MKSITILLLTISLAIVACSDNGPYRKSVDASAEIQQTLNNAKANNKPAVIIFGANWCSDCQALAKALSTSQEAASISNDFEVVKVNVGNFDTNLDITAKYGNPISGGIPGAAILSPDGELLYVTKPGQLSQVRQNNKLYTFFKQAAQRTAKSEVLS